MEVQGCSGRVKMVRNTIKLYADAIVSSIMLPTGFDMQEPVLGLDVRYDRYCRQLMDVVATGDYRELGDFLDSHRSIHGTSYRVFSTLLRDELQYIFGLLDEELKDTLTDKQKLLLGSD